MRGSGLAARRAALLDALAVAEGVGWARELRRGLRGEGRRIAGGWPGTLSEARSRAVNGCQRALRERGLGALSSVELDRLARRLNAAARGDWLNKAEPEDSAE
jgi:hypothetical protein